jgi:hypothetical protein
MDFLGIHLQIDGNKISLNGVNCLVEAIDDGMLMVTPLWNKSSEILPKNFTHVLCLNEANEMYVALFERRKFYKESQFINIWNSEHCCGSEKGDAVYWMELPQEPRK